MIKPYYETELGKLYCGDCLEVMESLPKESIQCCVTSPPYWGLRDYGIDSQIGLEQTPEGYVNVMTRVFQKARKMLRYDGTLWLNLGDSYASGKGSCFNPGGGESSLEGHAKLKEAGVYKLNRPNISDLEVMGLKPKDLVGIPWRVALALQADGWYLRSDIIWHKPNPMPESVTDRPTKSHEYIFLMSKNQKYFYAGDAVREPHTWADRDKRFNLGPSQGKGKTQTGKYSMQSCGAYNPKGRNKRSVWTITTQPYSEAHFATFPEKLIQPCIKAGCPEGEIVLDPFMGAGTTALVCEKLNRRWIGIEISEEYCEIAKARIEPEARQIKIWG